MLEVTFGVPLKRRNSSSQKQNGQMICSENVKNLEQISFVLKLPLRHDSPLQSLHQHLFFAFKTSQIPSTPNRYLFSKAFLGNLVIATWAHNYGQ